MYCTYNTKLWREGGEGFVINIKFNNVNVKSLYVMKEDFDQEADLRIFRCFKNYILEIPNKNIRANSLSEMSYNYFTK